MADTIRTEDALLDLFADNNSGNISPQDLRDFVVSIYDEVGEGGGGGGTPGGSNTQIQYNNAGAFGGDSGFTTNGAGSIDVVGDLDIDNININGNTISSTNTNGIIIISPNGTGSIQKDAGGNSRGNSAIDFQSSRNTSTQVASGVRSFIASGQNNTASGNYSFACGNNNISSGINAFACGSETTASGYASHTEGIENNAIGNYSHAEGAYNSALGTYSHAEGKGNEAEGECSHTEGNNNRAIGYASHAGGLNSRSRYRASMARASSSFVTIGDAQSIEVVLMRETNDSNPTKLFISDIDDEEIFLENFHTCFFEIYVVGRNSDTEVAETAGFKFYGVIKMDATAGTTAFVDVPTKISFEGTTNWDANVIADATTGSLSVEVEGADATVIRWVAYVKITEIIIAIGG